MRNNLFNFLKRNREEKVVTRIAPSPTGVMHIGTARTALFNYLFAKQNKGKFLLRIEDTDKTRSTKEFEKDILDGLNFLGLSYDAFFRQSERSNIYKKYLNKMISEGTAYVSEETEGNNKQVIRFKNPNKEITFQDIIRGEITFDTTELGDFVIAKSLEEPLYHLAVVVDDFEMKITHIIRGEDGISNTPRQILIQQAIGAPTPKYAHLPLILGEDRSKLSKRHGAASLTEFKEKGYLKEALVSYLALLGWNPGDEQEIFSLEELIKKFSLEKISKGGAIFNIEKLNWVNKEFLKTNPEKVEKYFLEQLKEFYPENNLSKNQIEALQNWLLDRVEVISEIKHFLQNQDFDYLFNRPDRYDPQKLIWKKSDREKTLKHLRYAIDALDKYNSEKISQEKAKEIFWTYAEEHGKGDVLWPVRYALSGKDGSPNPFELIEFLGKKESLERVKAAINKIEQK